jgi:DNA-binding beta-propeller fold protein YncE
MRKAAEKFRLNCAVSVLIFGCVLGGCASREKTAATKPRAQIQVWGHRGDGPAEFSQPRPITIAPDNFVYIADASGRIHKWTTTGKFVKSWRVPSVQKGEGAEGLATLKDGNIVLADTHYSKLRIYSPEGKLLRSFGAYGKGKGQFLLVTGVCVDAEGNIYCADYGGDFDRISKWTPQGELLASWPGHGEGPRQFRRPCGLAISKTGDLLVADIGNHRIQILDRMTGKYKGSFGKQGRAEGQFTYPYDVAVSPAGNIYTVEYGAHRVQKWSSTGKFLASFGGPGRKVGEFANPWGLAVDKDENVYVCDTQNHRVQKFRLD